MPWPLGIEDQSNVCCPRRRTHAPDPERKVPTPKADARTRRSGRFNAPHHLPRGSARNPLLLLRHPRRKAAGAEEEDHCLHRFASVSGIASVSPTFQPSVRFFAANSQWPFTLTYQCPMNYPACQRVPVTLSLTSASVAPAPLSPVSGVVEVADRAGMEGRREELRRPQSRWALVPLRYCVYPGNQAHRRHESLWKPELYSAPVQMPYLRRHSSVCRKDRCLSRRLRDQVLAHAVQGGTLTKEYHRRLCRV